MRFIKCLSLLTAMLLLCAALTVGLSENEAVVQVEEAEATLSLDEDAEKLL